MSPDVVQVRAARAADLGAVLEIHAAAVRTGTASFKREPPALGQMAARHQRTVAAGLPYLVAEDDGEIWGFADASPFRPRPAYASTVEDSVYVDADARRRGLGRALLQKLLEHGTRMGLRQMIAVIGDPDVGASVALHRAFGFRTVGRLDAVGFKLGQWRDVALMQRTLGPGLSTPPG